MYANRIRIRILKTEVGSSNFVQHPYVQFITCHQVSCIYPVILVIFFYSLARWRFGLTVTTLVTSTKLPYAGPG